MSQKSRIETKNYIIEKDLDIPGTWWKVISKATNRILIHYSTKKLALEMVMESEREGRL